LQNDLVSINNRFNAFLKDLNEENDRKQGQQSYNYKNHSSQRSSNNSSPLSMNMITKMYSKKKTGDENNSNNNELPERIYIKRNSLLTEMFRISHFRTIRHIFISIMIVLALQVIYSDLTEKGDIFFNFDLIHWCFGKMQVVFYVWLYMMLSSTLLVYFCFHYWANNRVNYIAKQSHDIKQAKTGNFSF
jgi:sterol O-acyltransferase